MEGQLIIDNWMLQDINQAFEQGLSVEEGGEIVVDIKKDSHRFHYTPVAVLQIDALLMLLVNIVLRNSLIVDDRFTHVWDKGSGSLQKLKGTNIINPFDFSSSEESIAEVRKAIVDELCVTRSIRTVQKANEILWESRGESFDDHMSQLVWGGAGYLARSHIYQTPYLGCPYRQALIRQTKFVGWRRDALMDMEHIINTKRANLFQDISSDRSAKYATFNLPPVATEVINESNDASQLIPVAMQLRDKYKKLRAWLKVYQDALDSDDPKSILKHRKILESVGRDIESEYSKTREGSTNVSIGTTWLNLTIPVTTVVDKLRGKFGVRAMLNDLVFASRGEKSLDKLLALFGEKNTKLSRDTHQHLIARYSRNVRSIQQ